MMDQGTHILVTGGSGFVGKAVLARLVEQPHYQKIYLLLRAKGEFAAEARLKQMLRQMFTAERAANLATKVQAVAGDFTLPGLGLSAEAMELMRRQTHQILHCGASTDFGAPLESARLNNTEGTRHVLDVAIELRERGVLQRLDYVSTAYICGKKSGVFSEDDLDRGQRFANHYERSKFEAELLLRENAARLPIAVYRPSIVVGDSRTGYTPHFKVLYWPILLLAKNLLPYFACNQRAYLDIVPVDYVADGLVALMQRPDTIGRTFLLAAGQGREIRIRDILSDAYELAGIRKRPIVPFWVFDLFRRTPFARLLPETFWAVAKLAEPYYDYLRGSAARFDARQTQAILEPLGIRAPHWREYKHAVLHFCLASRWGKRLPEPEYSYYLPVQSAATQPVTV